MIRQADFEDAIAAGTPIADADLSHLDWSDLPDGRVVLRSCRIVGSLAEAQLEGARFEHCDFSQASFRAANLAQAKFVQCTFFDVDARKGCEFDSANLVSAVFEQCNLALCRFGRATLYDVTLDRCKAAGASFEDADFSRKSGRQIVAKADLSGTMLDMASFRGVRLDGCALRGCSLRQSDFSRADLVEADFAEASLVEASFNGADMSKADLRGANLSGLNLAQAKSFAGIKVHESQVSALVGPLGIRVFPG